jgi:hypothetical protein
LTKNGSKLDKKMYRELAYPEAEKMTADSVGGLTEFSYYFNQATLPMKDLIGEVLTLKAVQMTGKIPGGNNDKIGSGNVLKTSEKVVITSAEDLIKNKALLQSPSDEANFWSGLGRGGDEQAANFTVKNGGTTLEQLLEKNNIEMPDYNPLDSTTVEAWEKASELYAEQASGKVNAIIGENLRPDSIWKTYELPALKRNPNVTEITETNPVTGEIKIVYKR